MWILEPLKNQSESWKSPGNSFPKKSMNPAKLWADTDKINNLLPVFFQSMDVILLHDEGKHIFPCK